MAVTAWRKSWAALRGAPPASVLAKQAQLTRIPRQGAREGYSFAFGFPCFLLGAEQCEVLQRVP